MLTSASVTAARRAMEKELKQAEGDVERLKGAIRALTAYENPRSVGKRMPNKKRSKVCETAGCGTRFTAARSDARFCSDCRRARSRTRSDHEPIKARGAEKEARARKKGLTIMKNTPSAKK